jgi:hypothetical protein
MRLDIFLYWYVCFIFYAMRREANFQYENITSTFQCMVLHFCMADDI